MVTVSEAAPALDRGAAASLVLRAAAASTLLGAAVVHARVVDAHFAQWWAEGVFFVALEAVEAALALALLRRASREVAGAAYAVSVLTVAVWVWSRTLGVPVGPGAWQPEAVGRADVVATVLEVATAVAVLPLALRRPVPRVRPRRGRPEAFAAAAIVAVVAAATAYGAVGAGAEHATAAHGERPLAPGEYPLGAPTAKPTRAVGPDFFFEARPLGRLVLELGVGPAAVGYDTIDVVAVDRQGRRVEVPDVRVTAQPPRAGLRPLDLRASRLAPGHFIVEVVRLRVPGLWRLRVVGRDRGRAVFDHAFAVPIARKAKLRTATG